MLLLFFIIIIFLPLDMINSLSFMFTMLRSAIREMVVRGAPAIAIAAALSLAAEVFNLNAFSGTSADAAAFLGNKLEYLVSR